MGLEEVMKDGITRKGREIRSLSLSGMPGRELSPGSELTGASVLNFSASRTVRYKFLLLKPTSNQSMVLYYGTLSYRSENTIRTFEIITPLLVPDLLRVLCIKKENVKLLKLLKLNCNNSEENK